jgi:cell wall-associated NlpC family hydrolase
MDPTPPAWAGRYIGIPFAERGRSHAGADCWYFVHLVLKEQFGIVVPTYDGVGWVEGCDRGALARFMAEHRDEWRRIETGAEGPGDVVLMRYMGEATHVGVVVAPPLMLHCERGTESCIADYTRRPFRFPLPSGRMMSRIEGFYRHASVCV